LIGSGTRNDCQHGNCGRPAERQRDPERHGGLADLHSCPLPWTGDFRARHGELRLADPPARCLLAVREPVAGLQFGSRPESATGSCKRSTLVHAT
jgi:hypothetical protein